MEANKQTRGKPRTEIKYLENERERFVTFSKRRSGIYKKANELVTKCGGEVALAVYSPAGRAFSFSHPSMEAVASRFLGHPISGNEAEKDNELENDPSLSEEQRKENIDKLTKDYSELMSQLEEGKQQEKMMKNEAGGLSSMEEERQWWQIPTDEMSKEQLRDANYRFGEILGIVKRKMEDKKNKGKAPCI